MKYFSRRIIIVAILGSLAPAYASSDDIIENLREKIHSSRITPEVEQRILQAKKEATIEDIKIARGQLLDEYEQFAGILDFYQRRHIPKPVLGYIMEHRDDIVGFCDRAELTCIEVAMMIEIYHADIVYRYGIHSSQDSDQRSAQHEKALQHVPEGVTVPEAPDSPTYQSIIVDLSKQLLFAYEEGVLVYVTPVTTGKKGFETPVGNFSIIKKQTDRWLKSPFRDIYYRLHVDYWVEFLPGYGLHDACNSQSCWRTKFGGSDYNTRGSHGCVNMPYDPARWLSNWALIDTTVRVQE